MGIIKEKKGDVTIYRVQKLIPDAPMEKYKNKKVNPKIIHTILTHNADVYDQDTGALLLKFRKNVLTPGKVDLFYDNVIGHANTTTHLRQNTTGKKNNDWKNTNVKSNIFGYFDRWTPYHNYTFRMNGVKAPIMVRECKFNTDHPEQYKNTFPMIKEVDDLYDKLVPDYYANQIRKARQTPFKIANTAFTTITTNVNYQTMIHKDRGDDEEGFGNLIVIEKGKYDGAETCFPQYGIGVDLRTNDVLFMDVHEWHGNLPMRNKSADAVRLSVVCYLRTKIWERTKGKTRAFMKRHNKTVKKYSHLIKN